MKKITITDVMLNCMSRVKDHQVLEKIERGQPNNALAKSDDVQRKIRKCEIPLGVLANLSTTTILGLNLSYLMSSKTHPPDDR